MCHPVQMSHSHDSIKEDPRRHGEEGARYDLDSWDGDAPVDQAGGAEDDAENGDDQAAPLEVVLAEATAGRVATYTHAWFLRLPFFDT